MQQSTNLINTISYNHSLLSRMKIYRFDGNLILLEFVGTKKMQTIRSKPLTLHTQTDTLGSTANGWLISITWLFDGHK